MIQRFKNYIGKKIEYRRSMQVISNFQKTNDLIPSKNIIITGSPRSGTTWLAEILQGESNSFMLFEPLSLRNEKFKLLGFDWRQHIPENENWPEAYDLFNDLFEGKYITPWMISHSDQNQLQNSHFFILKFVRANLLLPWLTHNFSFERQPIFIYRNPNDVVQSQLENNWNVSNSKFQIPHSRFAEIYYKPFEPILKTVFTPTEHLTARWCLDNYYLLNHPNNNKKWITVNYDTLLANPEIELKTIYSRLNLTFDSKVLNSIHQKSKSTYQINKKESQQFNISECNRIVELFEMKKFINIVE